MPTVVGVKVRPSGRILSFDAAGTEPVPGDLVVVSTERGEELGEVVSEGEERTEAELERKLKPILRLANEKDLERAEDFRDKEAKAMRRFRELVGESGLDMKPVDVEYMFDGGKVIFYFTAEERVDFRDLVKDLANEFKCRVDMRQIGVRDEARMVGGVGHCGQQLCCVRFGGEFEPVSIRMAKMQDLPLNPLKISGLCGRLMCCLRYEYDAYKDFKSRAPKVGAKIEAPGGEARVVSLDAPRERVTLDLQGNRITVPLEKMECEGCQGGRPCRVSEEALSEASGKKHDVLAPPATTGTLRDAQDQAQEPRASRSRRRRPGRSESPRAETEPAAQDDRAQSKEKQPKAQGSGQSRRKSGGSRRRGSSTDTRTQSKDGQDAKGKPPEGGSQPGASAGSGQQRRRRRPRRGGGAGSDT